MTPHDKTLSALLAELKTDEKSGLSSQEAAARLARDGENRLREGKPLLHPAGVGFELPLGHLRQAHQVQQLRRPGLGLGPGQAL